MATNHKQKKYREGGFSSELNKNVFHNIWFRGPWKQAFPWMLGRVERWLELVIRSYRTTQQIFVQWIEYRQAKHYMERLGGCVFAWVGEGEAEVCVCARVAVAVSRTMHTHGVLGGSKTWRVASLSVSYRSPRSCRPPPILHKGPSLPTSAVTSSSP